MSDNKTLHYTHVVLCILYFIKNFQNKCNTLLMISGNITDIYNKNGEKYDFFFPITFQNFWIHFTFNVKMQFKNF